MDRRLFLSLTVPAGLEAARQKRPRRTSRETYASRGVPDLPLVECPSPSLRGVELSDRFSTAGRIERSLRWQNITRAVETKYGIPRNYLCGMVAQESMGDPTLPNIGGDGGLGLIHMQPYMADRYGLKMITDSRRLRDFVQGRKINDLLERERFDLVEIAKEDERLHPVKNVDAAARMLCDHYRRTRSWTKALERYAGRHTYDTAVVAFSRLASSRKYVDRLGSAFDERNRKLIVGGRPLTFQRYLQIAHSNNICQFGLAQYVAMRR